jgi:hypothetical protein
MFNAGWATGCAAFVHFTGWMAGGIVRLSVGSTRLADIVCHVFGAAAGVGVAGENAVKIGRVGLGGIGDARVTVVRTGDGKGIGATSAASVCAGVLDCQVPAEGRFMETG